MIKKAASDKIFSALKDHYNDVKPDLVFNNIYELVIAVVLSAQTTDRQVNAATSLLFNKYSDFKSLARAKITDVEHIIKSTGFYKNKAKNIVNLSLKIVKTFDSAVPDTRESLITLPGVGRKSANVILSMGFNIPAFAVDTHVIRISNRLGYINSKDPYKVETAVTSLIPEKNWKDAHLLFIRHGRSICKARNPLCTACPIFAECSYKNKQE